MIKFASGLKEKKYLNLGSGPRGIVNEHWLNVDGFRDKNVQFLCDFGRDLPFEDNTFDGIFCEHVLEHFDYQAGQKLMSECLRILKTGGVVRVVVPNGQTILKSYFENPEFIVKYRQTETGQPMEAVNGWFYQRYEHQCIYDGKYLVHMLRSVNFSDAAEVSFRKSKFAEADLAIDDEKYAWESLYVEAIKG